jgi:hypothetical protein
VRRALDKPWMAGVAFLLSGASAAFLVLLAVFVFVVQPHSQSAQLRDAICGTFTDVAASPVTPHTTELGKRLIRDTNRGATVAGCPRP